MVHKRITFHVPWADVSEWNTVKDQIFSEDITEIIKAYETILMWKLRYNSIPAYIECTYSLLQVMVKEYEMNKNEESSPLYSEHDLQLSYSTALIRFVNHVSSLSSYKGESLYLAAKTQNIPDWIINMRHDAAHGQGLPTLDALYMAVELSLKWLLDNYWSNPDNFIDKSLDLTQPDLDSTEVLEAELNSRNFFHKAFEVWELCCVGKKVEYIKEMKREFFLHLEEMINLHNLYYNDIESEEFNKISSVSKSYNDCEGNKEINFDSNMRVKEFRKLLIKLFKNLLESMKHSKHSLLLSLFETTFLSEDIKPQKWKQIIHLIQEVNLFSQFVQILFETCGKGHKGASKWLKILLPAIKSLKKDWALFSTRAKEKNNYKTKELKAEIKKQRPKDLIMELEILKPPTITLEMMEDVLLNPEFLGFNEIKKYLKLINPPLPDSTFSLIENLIGLQKINGKVEMTTKEDPDKIFTVEDLQELEEKEADTVKEEADCSNGWVKSTIDIHTWSKCPLGLLPFQTKLDCSLANDLTWKRESICKKRTSMPLIKHSTDMKRRRETSTTNYENEI